MKEAKYTYKAKVVSVYDADTIRVNIQLGFGLSFNGTKGKGESIRLFGINAPEVRGDERKNGLISKNFVEHEILGKDVIIETIKDSKGKYGRYLANIYYIDLNGNEVNLNNELVKRGLAIAKEY